MKDVTTAWTSDSADPVDADADVSDVAWQRPSAPVALAAPDPLTEDVAATYDTVDADAEGNAPKQGFIANCVAKLKALVSKPTTPSEVDGKAEAEAEAEAEVEESAAEGSEAKKPAMVKVKELVCKLPDPTLLFVMEAAMVLLVYVVRPWWLRTWVARVVTPGMLVPTVAATALWRRTEMVSLRADPEYTSAAKPVPNAGLVVSLGESLRAREKEVMRKEEELRRGQLRLEVLRKEIEGKLPPQVSLANLLETENQPAAANVT